MALGSTIQNSLNFKWDFAYLWRPNEEDLATWANIEGRLNSLHPAARAWKASGFTTRSRRIRNRTESTSCSAKPFAANYWRCGSATHRSSAYGHDRYVVFFALLRYLSHHRRSIDHPISTS